MKKRLIILSDIWGKGKSEWLANYTQQLTSQFKLSYYDCCELGGVDKTIYTQKNLHRQFINGGIERAIETLIHNENKKLNILAFSIGGTIAWKFGLRTDKIESLCCLSSTRLRHESQKPTGKISLYFGLNDTHKPSENWIKKMAVHTDVFEGKDHDFYKDKQMAKIIVQQLGATLK